MLADAMLNVIKNEYDLLVNNNPCSCFCHIPFAGDVKINSRPVIFLNLDFGLLILLKHKSFSVGSIPCIYVLLMRPDFILIDIHF